MFSSPSLILNLKSKPFTNKLAYFCQSIEDKAKPVLNRRFQMNGMLLSVGIILRITALLSPYSLADILVPMLHNFPRP
jgi:hypothetical protein